MSPFTELDFLNESGAKLIADRVRDHRHEFIDRGTFYTLGASTYLDPQNIYPWAALGTNGFMANNFSDVHRMIDVRLRDHFDTESVYFPQLAWPGFHIFTAKCNGVTGSLHVDQPYQFIDFGQEWADPFSFTVMLETPSFGAGLEWWRPPRDHQDLRWISNNDSEPMFPPTDIYKYKIGEMVLHSGQFYHRIWNGGDMKPDEARISIQGHGVVLADGRICLYF